jgi:hypothetical protein
LKKYNETQATLYQTVNVPSTDLEFSVDAKLFAHEYTITDSCWAAAAIILRYLNNNNISLGETRIVYQTPHCPWTNTNTVHIIPVTDPNGWYNYSFNINTELANLPSINPLNIKKIQVSLYDRIIGC